MLQKKINQTNQCQFKFAEEGKGKLEGYASVFDSIDAVGDTIIKGAFAGCIDKDIPMFVNHDHGAIPVGTFKAIEDGVGLFVDGSINLQHKDGETVYSALKRGDITGMSIGFQMPKDGFTMKDDGGRIITEADLKEISIVTFPCEDSARITAVKQERWDECETIRDLERLIRDELDTTKSVACTLLSHFQRVMSGELTSAKAEIKSLTRMLNEYETASLLATVKNLGNKS